MPLPSPGRYNGNLFIPIDSGIPSVFDRRPHPLKSFEQNNGLPIQTNKFYANMLLENRNLPAFPHPYSIWWSRQDYLGIAVSHTQSHQRVFGHDPAANPCQFYFNPAGIQSVNFGATEFTASNMFISVDKCDLFSTKVSLRAENGTIKFPLYNGMGVVSAIYDNLCPLISSVVGFKNVHKVSNSAFFDKYEILLFNDVRWLMYVCGSNRPGFELKDSNHLVAQNVVNGLLVQIGECPINGDEFYDQTAGAFADNVTLEGSAQNGSTATYRLQYNIQGYSMSGKILVYALPHQVESFTAKMLSGKTTLHLDSTVMGKMTACVVNVLEMQEELPYYIGFLPWSVINPTQSDKYFNCNKYSTSEMNLMRSMAFKELDQDIKGQACLDSMYFSGKGIDKFAFILLVTRYILGDMELTKRGLDKLKEVFAIFTHNNQPNPLCYDTTWKGIISIAGYNDPNSDFGNTYYNDHHFHYGYFFHAAAVIGQIDKDFGGSWIEENKHWVNALIRDVANPSASDTQFPVSRSFDWFVGHSWAKGLFISGDGKDEESSSEDYHFAYGMKLWGQVIDDQAMEARGNLMLAIMRRSMNKYMIFGDDNIEQPSNFIKNKVSGITFENKIDHATYFGLNLEYIQGIHMIPLTPVSSFIRSPRFVKEEWDSLIIHIIDSVDSGWKGILKLNQSLFDPQASVEFFTSSDFRSQWLDGGMSRTWSIAFAKGLTK